MSAQPNRPGKGPITATVAGNKLDVIEAGAERLRILLELIGSARHSLRLLMYMFDPDRVGETVRDALIAAAGRGVEVRLLIDGFGSSATPKFFTDLGDSGGNYCVFNGTYGRRYLLRNHQKLVVADDRIAIIGGANIDHNYMADTGPDHWRDLWLRLEGPEAEVASRYFDAIFGWSKSDHSRLRTLRRTVGKFSQSDGLLQWKFSGPLSRRNSWSRSVGADIRNGSRLDMIFAYFAPPAAMIRRITRLGRRGCARIVTAAKSDNNTTIAAARHSYSRLLRGRVEMYEYESAKLHTKLAIVDDIVHIGSSNFDYRSLYLNLELMLRIQDPGFAASMRGYFERELEHCQRITPALHKRRASVWRRVEWAISHFLVNVMDFTVTRELNLRD